MDAIDHSVAKKIIVKSAQNKFDDARIAHQIRDVTDTQHSVMICMSAVRRACAASDIFNWAVNVL